MKSKIQFIFSKSLIFCKSYVELCVWLLIFAIGIRLFEAIFFSHQLNYGTGSSIIWNLKGLGYDTSLFLRISVWILIIFVSFSFFNEKITRIILRILLSIMLLLSMICVVFFVTSGYLLDNAIFFYTFKEVLFIINTGSNTPVWVFITIVVLPLLFYYLSGKRIKINSILLTSFVLLLLSSFIFLKNIPLYKTQYHLKVNKEYFFIKSLFKKPISHEKYSQDDMTSIIKEFRSYFPEHQFAETKYPFLNINKNKDVLSPFFNLKSEPPNIVIIIVEGLGYEYLYNDFHGMPFLDSLSKKSLSWENCFSTATRTFGILPALYGNTPLGEKGFVFLCPYTPEFQSLPRILHQNNYTNTFFHGGLSSWFKMDILSEMNDVNYLKEDDWDEDIKAETAGTKWGYEDHLIYKQAHRKLNLLHRKPRMDIYLSNSTHHPWEYPRIEYFRKTVTDKIKQCRTTTEKQKKEMLNSLQYYSGFAYSDWSLQQLMEEYKKRDDFQNTIFIITGDHHFWSKQFLGYYNYHVPLIIYSPMLNTSRKMKGVVSLCDIPPTILSMLNKNYNIKIPQEVAWLNTAIDTSLAFNANTFSYLLTADGMCEGIIYKNHLYCEGLLDEFTENGPIRVKNPEPEIIGQMDRLLNLYKTIDSYILQNDALVKKSDSNQLFSITVLDIYDTISANSHFANLSKLPVIEDPVKPNYALFFDKNVIHPIHFFNHSFTSDDIEQFRINIGFKIFLKEANDGLKIHLEVNLIKNGENIIIKHDYLNLAQEEQWYDYNYSFICRKETCERLGKGCTLRVFLYNDEQEAYLDDITVKFMIEKRQR